MYIPSNCTSLSYMKKTKKNKYKKRIERSGYLGTGSTSWSWRILNTT